VAPRNDGALVAMTDLTTCGIIARMRYCALIICITIVLFIPRAHPGGVLWLVPAFAQEETMSYFFPIAEVSEEEAAGLQLIGEGQEKVYFFLNEEGIIYIEATEAEEYQALYNIFNHDNFREYYVSSFVKFAIEEFDIYITRDDTQVVPALRHGNSIYLKQELIEAATIAGWNNSNLPALTLAPIIYGASKYDGEYDTENIRARFYEELEARFFMQVMVRKIKEEFAGAINSMTSFSLMAAAIKESFREIGTREIIESVLIDYPVFKTSLQVQMGLTRIEEWLGQNQQANVKDALLYVVEERWRK